LKPVLAKPIRTEQFAITARMDVRNANPVKFVTSAALDLNYKVMHVFVVTKSTGTELPAHRAVTVA
jgi:hypothetical protein